MTSPRVTFLASTEAQLHDWLEGHPDGHERGAFILFRKFDRDSSALLSSARYVAIDVIPMEGDWVLGSSSRHVRINMRKLPELYFRCETENLELGFAHSHPSGATAFSTQDDQNEKNILQGYAGCNGNQVDLVALVLCDGKWLARIRTGNERGLTQPARHVSVVGTGLNVHLPPQDAENPEENIETLLRQEAAFGQPFSRKLQSLRVVVVGAGGTGSPLTTLLARSGVGEIVIVDGDNLEKSNLNRVRGYRADDVGKNKAQTLAEYIRSLGLAVHIEAIPSFLHESPEAVDALSSADVIFGCTDDITGRDILNQSAYYYALPYIDLGLSGKIDVDVTGEPYLRDHRGRVSQILPEHGECLRCQGVVTENKLAYEEAVRKNPELANLDAETLRREYYLTGGGEQAPGVGPFTSMTADLGVSALMNLVRPFWKIPSDLRSDNVWIDFVHLSIHSNSRPMNPDCFCCGGRHILLKAENGNRLDMPSLGRIK